MIPLVAEAVRARTTARLLDCGCGTGHNLGWLRSHGTAVGVDLNWTGLERFDRARFEEIARVDDKAWGEELKSHDELFSKLASHLPPALETRRGSMHQKLAA